MQWIVRAALAIVFIGMGILHFVPGPAKAMSAIIPPSIKRVVPGVVLVRFTGVCEILGGIGLLVPGIHVIAGIALVVFLVAVFPANIHMATNPELFPTIPSLMLWLRLPLQGVLILWAYWYTRGGPV